MPRRKNVERIETIEVQGEGSWVEFRSLRVREVREVVNRREGATGAEAFALGMEVLRKVLVGWNWCDEDGQPLPQPLDDPNQFEELTNEESEYLIQLFQKQTEQAKKSRPRRPKRSG